MAQTVTGIESSKVISNLDTYNHTTLAAGLYTVSLSMNEIPPSGVSIAIQLNASTKITSVAPSSTQSHVSVSLTMNCATSDLISVVVSSATASDANKNAVKGILSIRRGT